MSNQSTRVKNMKGPGYEGHYTTGEMARYLGIDKKNLKKAIKRGLYPGPDATNDRGWLLYTPKSVRRIDKLRQRRLEQPKRVKLPKKVDFSPELFRPKALKLYWYFVWERQNIYHRRNVLAEDPPWTEDPVMQREFIINMYRELDPATKWLRKHCLRNDNLTTEDKIFNVMFFRFIGSQERTMNKVGILRSRQYNRAKVVRALRSMDTPFGRAYTVYANVHNTKQSKIENVAELFERLADEARVLRKNLQATESAEEAYNILRELPAFGPFLSYQVLVDLLYPPKILPYSHNDFVVAGPGAIKGMRVLMGNNFQGKYVEPGIWWLQENQRAEFDRLGLEFKWLTNKKGREKELPASDIQNTLCEFGKYVRVRKTGKYTRKFKGGQGAK